MLKIAFEQPARRDEHPVAWLSLAAGDNDPARFWHHTVAALDRARPGTGERLTPLLGPPAPTSFQGLVTALINDLAGEEALLVLDVPTATMPGPVRAFADNQPVTSIVNTVRDLFAQKPVSTSIWTALAWCAGILIVAYALAMVTYRRKIAQVLVSRRDLNR